MDYLRSQAHMMVGIPGEAERVRQPVDAVEDQVHVQGIDDSRIWHAGCTDRADVADLKAAGHSEEAIFEVTVAAAVGAALRSLDAGMRAAGWGSGDAAGNP